MMRTRVTAGRKRACNSPEFSFIGFLGGDAGGCAPPVCFAASTSAQTRAGEQQQQQQQPPVARIKRREMPSNARVSEYNNGITIMRRVCVRDAAKTNFAQRPRRREADAENGHRALRFVRSKVQKKVAVHVAVDFVPRGRYNKRKARKLFRRGDLKIEFFFFVPRPFEITP